MRLARLNGSVVLTAARGDRVLTATFVSTANRLVESVEGFRTYAEKLGDSDVRAEWDSAIQNYRSYREEYGDTEYFPDEFSGSTGLLCPPPHEGFMFTGLK